MFQLIYRLGQKKRNPSINSWFAFLKESEKWSIEELEEYQLKRFNLLLDIAKKSPFYSKKYKNLPFSKLNSLADVRKIPILTKGEILEFQSELPPHIKFKKLIKATTSGTSGESLSYYRNEEADSFTRAVIQRGYSWYNVKYWERNGYFWG